MTETEARTGNGAKGKRIGRIAGGGEKPRTFLAKKGGMAGG